MRQNHDPARSRRAAVLYRQGGLSVRAICERFAVSQSTLFKALKRLDAEAETPSEGESGCR